MTNELSHLQQQIHEALQLLQESKLLTSNTRAEDGNTLPASDLFFSEHSSLLDKCAQVCSQYQEQKPTVRIIHHLACTGGTLLSKCISVMPNVYLLSEVHPHSTLYLNKTKVPYMPSDLASLSRFARVPNINHLEEVLFKKGVETINEHVKSFGGNLVLREHSHTDFHTGTKANEHPSLQSILSESFNIISVVTFRDPIDSYLSLKENNWVQFSPKTFEEYCSRILLMLEFYEGVPLYHYESLVENPSETLMKICDSLSIEYNEDWPLFFDIAQVSGDSGRSGNQISKRPRRSLDESFQQEVLSSSSYKIIRAMFNYLNL